MLLVGVAVGDKQPDVVTGVARFVVRDGVHDAACLGRAGGASCRPGGEEEGAVRHVGWRARCFLRRACILRFLSA